MQALLDAGVGVEEMRVCAFECTFVVCAVCDSTMGVQHTCDLCIK